MVNRKLLAAEIAGTLAVFALVLFFSAGTVAWAAAWVFLVLMGVFTVAISVWLLRHDPALLAERMTGIGKAGEAAWDKVFFAVVNVLFLAWFVLTGLDAVRFGWSHVPVWLQAAGTALLILSFYVFFITFRENPYLSPAVRLQSERGQTVISTGPYRIVRHPLYAGAIAYFAGTALLLGSWWGLAWALLTIVPVIMLRAVREERMLLAELPGYEAYMARVRWRFIPHVW